MAFVLGRSALLRFSCFSATVRMTLMTFFGRAFSFAKNPSSELLILIAMTLAALALMPVYVTRYLPINDYPFHLARMVILAQLHNPIFARFYEQGSFLLPNVGMDAVVVPLSKIL